MELPDNLQNFENHLREKMKGLTDNELKEVLKKRKQYRPEAAAFAIQEAIRRKIINSEEDLNSEDFNDPGDFFTLFPCPDEVEAANKLFRSLTRSLMIVGLIPIVFGVMKFTLAKNMEATALTGLGIVWIALAWLAMEKREVKFLYPLLALALLSTIYTGRVIRVIKDLDWSDWLVPVVLYLAIFYLIFYARAILRRKILS